MDAGIGRALCKHSLNTHAHTRRERWRVRQTETDRDRDKKRASQPDRQTQ